jgi:single-strand DNA-binding protein
MAFTSKAGCNLDSWEDKATGQKRSKLKVVAEALQLLGAKPSGGSGGNYSERSSQSSRPAPQERSGPPQGASAAPADDYQEDDDIPF